MKKIAFLILAHTDPVQLNRTIVALDYKYFDIYIHIDERCNIEDFKLDKIKLKNSNMYVLENRKKVIWGDISIVDATLQLYSEAYKHEKYIRYVTMSGLDYPIVSNEKIYNTLSREDIEFIGGGN